MVLPGGLPPSLYRPGYAPLRRYPPRANDKASAEERGKAEIREQMLAAWPLADDDTVRVNARKPPPPRILTHHPVVLRLAQDWSRPACEVEAGMSAWEVLDAWDARMWLYDQDETPSPQI